MGKYDKLAPYLEAQPSDEVRMDFAEIERVIGDKLPPRAQLHRAWWSNNPSNNVMTKVWRDAGFKTERVDIAAGTVVFRRVEGIKREIPMTTQRLPGMADEAREFKNDTDSVEKKPRRSPLWGALKGTFTIEEGYDLAQPTMSPEELDEMDANLERTADLIDKGLSGKHR
jgi:hypothetical protein